MNDFADELGPAYLNLVIRRLGQRLASEGNAYFARYELEIPATGTAIMTYIVRREQASVISIADALGYSHQAVAKAADKLESLGLVESGADEDDLRVRQLSPTDRGIAEVSKLQNMTDEIEAAFQGIFDETTVDLFHAIRAFEKALDARPLIERLVEQREKGAAVGTRNF